MTEPRQPVVREPMGAAWSAALLAFFAIVLLVGSQVWARHTNTLSPVLPLLGGLGLGVLAGLVGAVGLVIRIVRHRVVRRELVLLSFGILTGLVCVLVVARN